MLSSRFAALAATVLSFALTGPGNAQAVYGTSAPYVTATASQPQTCTEAYHKARTLCPSDPVRCEGGHQAFLQTCKQTGRYWSAQVHWEGLRRE